MRAALAITAMAALLCAPAMAHAQARGQLRDSQLRLDSIRQERRRLQQEMEKLHNQVRDASRELTNISRQRATSVSALQEIELQSRIMEASITETTARLDSTRARLLDRTAALRGRLRSIYERGSLHTVRVLLSAEDFGDLLNRYKYLHLMALYDRAMVDDVQQLEDELAGQETELRSSLALLQDLRTQKAQEVSQLQRLESQRQTTLRQFKRRETSTASRIEELTRDEARLSNVIAELERKRKEEEERGKAAAADALTTRDLGSLNWPVEGRVIYRFGPERKPNGVILKNHGIGIAAVAGTPVKAVESGTVVLARPFEGYGPTVMLSHGGGYYTLYMYLRAISVREGQKVVAGQVVGTVGGEQTPEGAHLEFQVRAPQPGGIPEAVDPLDWLRKSAGQ